MSDVRIPMAIDGGRYAGWAIAPPGSPKPKAGPLELGPNLGAWNRELETALFMLIDQFSVTEIIHEAPIISDHGGSGVNIHEVDQAMTFRAIVRGVAYERGLMFDCVARSTVVKHIGGVGRGTSRQFKDYCILGCQRKGWNPVTPKGEPDENVCDALSTLDWYAWDRKISVGWNCQPAPGPLFATNKPHIKDLSPKAQEMVRAAMRMEK